MITIDVRDQDVLAAFHRLIEANARMRPALRAIGERLTETTKRRFETSTGPDGGRWAPNSRATYEALAAKKGKFRKKDGKLSKSSTGLLATKKPLIGESKALSTTIAFRVEPDAVRIGSPMIYSAVQQFGAEMGEFGRYYQLFRRKYAESDFRRYAGTKKGSPIPWGNIPARPFLGLSAQDKADVVEILQEHLLRSARS